MTVNTQAASAGESADEIIKQLANPQAAIVTDKATVDVLDKTQPAQAAPEEDWKKRFTGYKASTDSTIHKLRQQASQFSATQAENATLKEQLTAAQEAVPNTPDEMLALFSQEEVDGFTKMMDNRVGGLQGRVNTLQAEVDASRQAKFQADVQKEHTDVVAAVSGSVPNYNKIDTSDEFKKWIKEPDQFGNIRFDLLVKAKQEVPPDIGRIVSFYTEFASTQKQTGAQAPKKPTIQELMQTPKSVQAGGVAPQPGLGKVWNTVESSEFYKNKALGKYSPEEAEALEQDLYRSIKARQR